MIHHGAARQDDGLIVLFSGHMLSERARTARTRVQRIALTYVIELLMEKRVISSDGKDFLAITTNSLHCILVFKLFKVVLIRWPVFSVLNTYTEGVPTWARGVCMFSPLSGYALFLPLAMTWICRL